MHLGRRRMLELSEEEESMGERGKGDGVEDVIERRS